MGNHRADRRAGSRRRSEQAAEERYVGRRVAGRSESTTPPAATPLPAEPVVVLPAVDLAASEATTTASLKPAVPGKRKAVKHAGSRTSVLRALPSMPVVAGVATLAVSAGGVLTSTHPELMGADSTRIAAPNAATGTSGTGIHSEVGRSPVVSRDSSRDALEDASSADLVQEVEQQAEQRNAALGELAEQAEKEAKQINLNRWVLPVDAGAYRLSAEFGQAGGYWSSGYHTGLDFAAPTGTQIRSVANGVITEMGYDGAYGNKTVVTLEDGTEIWYCHQTAFAASEGDTVVAGQVIGYVGSTGNTTGPHLHLEVRPGGGDPTDPYAAMVVNGVTP